MGGRSRATRQAWRVCALAALAGAFTASGGCGFGLGAGSTVAKGTQPMSTSTSADADFTVRTDNIDFLFMYAMKDLELVGTMTLGSYDIRTRGGTLENEDGARFAGGLGASYALPGFIRAFGHVHFDALGAPISYSISRAIEAGVELRQRATTSLYVRFGVHLDTVERTDGGDDIKATGVMMSVGLQSFFLQSIFKKRRN
ncbi:MAG: hypothetical protein IT370_04985 [Deltaproteobacteria bacterium]|nr:hypothetical protein [Deltaproteobacteria bacterium]